MTKVAYPISSFYKEAEDKEKFKPKPKTVLRSALLNFLPAGSAIDAATYPEEEASNKDVRKAITRTGTAMGATVGLTNGIVNSVRLRNQIPTGFAFPNNNLRLRSSVLPMSLGTALIGAGSGMLFSNIGARIGEMFRKNKGEEEVK
jgi:hypothetical protein